MIRKLRKVDPVFLTVGNNLFSAGILFIVLLFTGGLLIDNRSLVLLIIMGVIQFGLPYYFYSLSLQRLPARRVAMLTLLEPVLVPLWTFIGVGERVPTMTFIGGIGILIAVFLHLFMKKEYTEISHIE